MVGKVGNKSKKPASVAADRWKSAKWDELTEGREFGQSDVPTLTLLVQWYAVMERCIADIEGGGGAVVFENNLGDVKPLPQIGVMKQASAEIRQLNKQLGINDEAKPDKAEKGAEVTPLAIIQGRRADKARAANA